MKAATQERIKVARENISIGAIVFIRLKSSGREYRAHAIGTSQHNVEVILNEDDSHWTVFDPDELIGVRVVENHDG